MVEVPLDRFAKAAFERFLRGPPHLVLQFRAVDGVAPVVPRSVVDKGNEIPVRIPAFTWTQLIEDITDRVYHLNILFLTPPSNVVGLTYVAVFQDPKQRPYMIVYVQPVAHIFAVAINRNRVLIKGIEDHDRNEFFGVLVRAVVI